MSLFGLRLQQHRAPSPSETSKLSDKQKELHFLGNLPEQSSQKKKKKQTNWFLSAHINMLQFSLPDGCRYAKCSCIIYELTGSLLVYFYLPGWSFLQGSQKRRIKSPLSSNIHPAPFTPCFKTMCFKLYFRLFKIVLRIKMYRCWS